MVQISAAEDLRYMVMFVQVQKHIIINLLFVTLVEQQEKFLQVAHAILVVTRISTWERYMFRIIKPALRVMKIEGVLIVLNVLLVKAMELLKEI